MLIVVSPAKRLDWEDDLKPTSDPEFRGEANRLAGHMRQLGLGKLKTLMNLSDDLARLNRDRFRAFSDAPDVWETRPAVRAFAGDTYVGLDARSVEPDTMDWAQDHLRILSGLYGVLKPLDAIQAYRLEMGSRLKTRRGTTLYDFWGDQITTSLNAAAKDVGAHALLNCASKEYFSVVNPNELSMPVVTPIFLEDQDGEGRTISFFAKRARGAMARFVIDRRMANTQGLRDFDAFGYKFDAEASTPDAPVFRRPYEA